MLWEKCIKQYLSVSGTLSVSAHGHAQLKVARVFTPAAHPSSALARPSLFCYVHIFKLFSYAESDV